MTKAERSISCNLGIGGKPRAAPHFSFPHMGEEGLRHPHWCCNYGPAPNFPHEWLDGGAGWVTKYFADVRRRDPEVFEPGLYRCQLRDPYNEMQPCEHDVAENDCCKGSRCCWMSFTDAHSRMERHLLSVHGLSAPPSRPWSTTLWETEGCLDALFCAPCQGSRQMMALAGWEDELHIGWCLFFAIAGFFGHKKQLGYGYNGYWLPAHLVAAIMTRFRVVGLHSIDENVLETYCTACCCSCCSLAQTQRELTAAGVWPGGTCPSSNPGKPRTYGTLFAPPQRELR